MAELFEEDNGFHEFVGFTCANVISASHRLRCSLLSLSRLFINIFLCRSSHRPRSGFLHQMLENTFSINLSQNGWLLRGGQSFLSHSFLFLVLLAFKFSHSPLFVLGLYSPDASWGPHFAPSGGASSPSTDVNCILNILATFSLCSNAWEINFQLFYDR